MKKFILSVGVIILLSTAAFAQPKTTQDSISSWLDKIYAEQEAVHLKSYYASRQIADACEAWRSCAVWAFNEYVKDQTFKVTKAEVKTRRKVYRHRVTKETHLFIEATYPHRTVRLEFTTPHIGERKRPYNYIAQFPK